MRLLHRITVRDPGLLHITQHVPDKHFQMDRYEAYPELVERAGIQAEAEEKDSRLISSAPAMSRHLWGWSPEVTGLDASEHRSSGVPSRISPDLIKKIWEMDPLSCPQCRHEMRIISLIHEPDVTERILRHLDS